MRVCCRSRLFAKRHANSWLSNNARRLVSSEDSRPPAIAAVSANSVLRCLTVKWADGCQGRFPYVWLRDNCPAPHTYTLSERCHARHMLFNQLDIDVKPLSFTCNADALDVEWPGQLPARYRSQWLRQRNLDDQSVVARRPQLAFDERVLWSAQEYLDSHLERCQFDFDTLLSNDRQLHDFLCDLCHVGLVFVTDAPSTAGQLARLAARIGFEYRTHYRRFFEVRSSSDPSNVAYTSGALGLHTDLPYLNYPPQIQALHCIQQSEGKVGGESHFCDGFKVADALRSERKDVFELLSTTLLEYVDDGVDEFRFDLWQRAPVLSVNPSSGSVERVQFSNQQRSWFYQVPLEKIYGVYAALKVFNDCCYDSRHLLQRKLRNGEIAVFDNLRVLHGRAAFERKPGARERVLEGTYFTWDFVKSKIRVLRDQLAIEPNQVSV